MTGPARLQAALAGAQAEPESSAALQLAARLLLQAGAPYQACGFFQKALAIDPSSAQVEKYFNSAKNLLVERWHYRMLNDTKRNLAYRDAIKERIKNEDVVLDIGCGSGILSFYASEAGASKIIACESSTVMYNIAVETIKQNCMDNIIAVNESSENVDIDLYGGKVTTVVTEIFDAGLFGERALQTLSDAWKRLLKSHPNGKIIPARAVLHICGLQSDSLAKKHRLVRSEGNNIFSYINFNDISVSKEDKEPYDSENLSLIADIQYVTNAEQFLTIDFENIDDIDHFLSASPISKSLSLKPTKAGKIDAFAMWFDLILSKNISITGDPRSSDKCSSWDPAIFHIMEPIPTNLNDMVVVELKITEGKIVLINEMEKFNSSVYVSKEVLRILNDGEYINSMIGAVGASCVHLVQLYPFESVKVLDYTPFPIIGLLMLTRGIKHLVCSSASKELILKLAEYNNIDLKKMSFLDIIEYNTIETYEMIINYFVEPLGELKDVDINFLNIKKLHLLKPSGIIMPHKLKMVAKLVSSDHLNMCNRVYDYNLTDNETDRKFRVANYVNMYQVTQNSFSPADEFPKVYLSDEVVIYRQCLNPRLWETIEVCITADGTVNAIQSYFRIQLIPHGEELSSDRRDSYINNVYHLIDPPISVKKGDKINILVFSENDDSIKMILDAD